LRHDGCKCLDIRNHNPRVGGSNPSSATNARNYALKSVTCIRENCRSGNSRGIVAGGDERLKSPGLSCAMSDVGHSMPRPSDDEVDEQLETALPLPRSRRSAIPCGPCGDNPSSGYSLPARTPGAAVIKTHNGWRGRFRTSALNASRCESVNFFLRCRRLLCLSKIRHSTLVFVMRKSIR
jgi:hypothetical protein